MRRNHVINFSILGLAMSFVGSAMASAPQCKDPSSGKMNMAGIVILNLVDASSGSDQGQIVHHIKGSLPILPVNSITQSTLFEWSPKELVDFKMTFNLVKDVRASEQTGTDRSDTMMVFYQVRSGSVERGETLMGTALRDCFTPSKLQSVALLEDFSPNQAIPVVRKSDGTKLLAFPSWGLLAPWKESGRPNWTQLLRSH